MSDSKHQLSDRGGDGPGRQPRGNGKSSDERGNSTARTLQHSAMTGTPCGLPLEKGRNSKSTDDYDTIYPMHVAIHTRMTPTVEDICLPLAGQSVAPTVPQGHEVLGSPPQSVPMQRGRAYYEPPSGQPPSTAGITITAGPCASPEYDAENPCIVPGDAQNHSLGQIPANNLIHPTPRHLNGMAKGFLDCYVNRGENIGTNLTTGPGPSSLPDFTSFLRHSMTDTMAYDPKHDKLPPILSSQRSSSKVSPQQGLINTTTNRSKHQGKEANEEHPPKNPFAPSSSGSPTKFPIASRPKEA